MSISRNPNGIRSFDMPQEPLHKNLRSRACAALVSGCLVMTMFPAMALAQPTDAPEPPNNNQNMGQQQYGDGDNGQENFGGMSIPQAQQRDMWNGNQEPGSQFGQPDAQPRDDAQNAPQQGEGQQPAQQEQNQQQGQPDQQQGQPGQQTNQPGQQQGGQPGQMGQQQGGQPGQMGQQPPMMPEQVRTVVERMYDILGIDKTANPIDKVMEKLGFATKSSMDNMMNRFSHMAGQPGQQQGGQPGQQQAGQPGQQPGNQQGGQPGQPGGMNDAPTSYDAANKPLVDANGVTYKSSSDSQNAVLVDGKTLTLSNATIDKTGNASNENADFYGTNAAILANNGANLTITGTTVTTDGTHANGVFSYGTGTSIAISDSTITTSGNNSGGLMTTGGASMTATNLTVNTSGNSSAAIRTDRGGGTVSASQGTYSTTGVGSPAIYSTADVTVNDATLSATNSEAVVIEGGNSVTLNNANVTGSNAKLNGQSTIKTNVLIYQSMSGDASEGASNFTMTGGSLTSKTGAMFHVTNTTTTIDLNGVALTGASDSNDFLIATADAWGTSGKNGGHATVNLTSQKASGNITVDSVSSVALNLKGNSSYTGAIAAEGTVDVAIDAGCTWTLTGDSHVTSLDNAGTINLNGYTLYVNGVAYSA